MTTYYVDYTGGSNAYSGLTEELAWESVSKVNSVAFNPGDQVLFKRGERWECWDARLSPSVSGTLGNPILFGSYGTGDLPIISAGHALTSGWTDDGGNVWHCSVTWATNIVAFNGVSGNKQAALGTVNSDKDWYWATNVLYVYSVGNPASTYTEPGIEAAYDYACISTNKDYLTFENFDLRLTNSTAACYCDGSSNIIVQHCEMSLCEGHGIDQGTGCSNNRYHGNIIHDNASRGIYIEDGSLGCIMDDNAIYNCHAIGIDIWGDTHQAYNNTVYNCGDGIYLHFADSTMVHDNTLYNNTDLSFMGEGTGISLECSNLAWVYGNDIYGNLYGIEVWGGVGEAYGNSDDNLIYCNKVHDNTYYGIDYTGVDNIKNDNIIYYNLCYGNGTSNIRILYASTGCKLYNNVLDGGGAGLIISAVTGWDLKNNIFSNPTGYCLETGSDCGVTHDHNLYYKSSGDFISYNGVGYNSSEIIGGFEATAVVTDPLFTDAISHDYSLQAGSPAIDAGIDVGLISDYRGYFIIDTPDIGAYESYTATGGGTITFLDSAGTATLPTVFPAPAETISGDEAVSFFRVQNTSGVSTSISVTVHDDFACIDPIQVSTGKLPTIYAYLLHPSDFYAYLDNNIFDYIMLDQGSPNTESEDAINPLYETTTGYNYYETQVLADGDSEEICMVIVSPRTGHYAGEGQYTGRLHAVNTASATTDQTFAAVFRYAKQVMLGRIDVYGV